MPEFSAHDTRLDELKQKYENSQSIFQALNADYEEARYKVGSLTEIRNTIRRKLLNIHFLLQDVKSIKTRIESIDLTGLENMLFSDLQRHMGFTEGESGFLKQEGRLPTLDERNAANAIDDSRSTSKELRGLLNDVLVQAFKTIEKKLQEVDMLIYHFRIDFQRISAVNQGALSELQITVPDDTTLQKALDDMIFMSGLPTKAQAGDGS